MAEGAAVCRLWTGFTRTLWIALLIEFRSTGLTRLVRWLTEVMAECWVH